MKCKNCGYEFEGKFCPECGTRAEPEEKCPVCGTVRQNNQKFCSECGYSFLEQTDGGKIAVEPVEADEGEEKIVTAEETVVTEEKPVTAEEAAVTEDTAGKETATPVTTAAPKTANSSTVTPKSSAPKTALTKPERKYKNIVMPIICGACLVVSLIFIILSFVGSYDTRNASFVVCILFGCAEVITGAVFFFIYKHRVRYTCPVCGTKRERHSEYLDSREQIENSSSLYQRKCYHRYKYTYVCPFCGETLEEIKEEFGGARKVYSSGRIEDNIKPPHADY